MRKEQVSQIISGIDEKYIDEATEFALKNGREAVSKSAASAGKTGRRPRRFGWGAAAACLALIAVLGYAAHAVSAEAREYDEAVAFFEDNGLSAEGLSRSEVKAVYRDITERRFSYGKTADLILHTVLGLEIRQDEPTPEELSALWDKNVLLNSAARQGIGFRVDCQYVYDERKGFDVLEKSVLECLRDGETLWRAEFTDFYIEDYARFSGVTVVWGRNEVLSSGETTYGWIACVDDGGNIIWQRRLEHGFGHEYVGAVLSNGDGTWAVISRGDLKYLCLSCYDSDGGELSFRKTEVGNLGIRNAARLGDGYVVQLWNQTSRDTALLYMMDREGRVTDSFSYKADDCEYYITDLTEFGGQIYLSAYAVPIQHDAGGRHEIANVLDYVLSKEGWEISDEKLTPLVRENYTAVLLVCDPEEGIPRTFYSVKGSLGGRLSVNDAGELEWDVESVASTFFSPATSAFTIGGACEVFRYTFDETGALTGQTDTGETVPYWR